MKTPVWGFFCVFIIFLVSCTGRSRTRVVVLGMDGLTPQLLFKWARAGELPNFEKMMKESSFGRLASTLPPYSSQAWTSCITGVNPGKHGIHGFLDLKGPIPDNFDSDSTSLAFHSSLSNKAVTLWEILGQRGKTSIAINIPLTSPVFEISGIMIGGFPQPPGAPYTYPESLEEEIPGYRPDIYGEDIKRGKEDDFLHEMYDISQRRLETSIELYEQRDWDLFFVVFTIPDRIQHYFFKYMDEKHPQYNATMNARYGKEVKKVYRWMDEVLGEFTKRLDEDTYLVVLSDHGFRPVRKQVNGEVLLREVNTDSLFMVYATENFGATFRVKPRYPIIKTEETASRKKQIVDSLIGRLENLRDPLTGVKVISEVYRKEEIYTGPYLAEAPDVVAIEAEGYLFLNWVKRWGFPVVQQVPIPRFFSGFHQVDGVILIHGEGIRRDHETSGADILDVAPSILTFLGIPAGSDMDGEQISDAFSNGFFPDRGTEQRVVYEIDIDRRKYILGDEGLAADKIEDQLKSIGYIQ